MTKSMIDTTMSPEDLESRVREIASAESASDAFKILLDSARVAAPRAAVLLVRQGQLRGWAAVGYPSQAARTFRDLSIAIDTDWTARLAGVPGESLRVHRGNPTSPEFGQPRASEWAESVLRVKGRPIAVLIMERERAEEPWSPHSIALLVQVASMRLELDLASRKLEQFESAGGPLHAVSAQMAPTASAEIDSTKISAPVAGTEVARPALDSAKRYARLIASDIRLYNEEAVQLGRRDGDLLVRLGDQLTRGKDAFLKRHRDLGPAGVGLFHEVLVEVLAGGNATLLPRRALD